MVNRVDDSRLAAALSTPDDGVNRPPRVQPTSAITGIAALDVNECWSRVERAPNGMLLAEFANASASLRDDLRNNTASSVRHAKAKTGHAYKIETGDFISADRNIYLVCVVTRTA